MPTTDVDGITIHYEDTGGDGPPVWFMHGEPTWSFLWRKVIPPVAEAGFRCIAPDMAGFGKSDKPTDFAWYTYDRHCAMMGALLEQLDLRDVTMVVHDWGGPVGLRVGVEHPDRVSRFVIMDTGLFTGHQKMTDAWLAFRDFVERTEDLPIGMLVRNATARGMDDETVAQYEDCFPDAASKAGARAFPLMLPTSPDMPAAEAGQRVLEALKNDDRPKLTLWADSDPVLPLEVGQRFSAAINGPEPIVIENASHFLQEDAGEVIGEHIARWLTESGATA
jgi:haloalkane dehalogenase